MSLQTSLTLHHANISEVTFVKLVLLLFTSVFLNFQTFRAPVNSTDQLTVAVFAMEMFLVLREPAAC